MLHADKSAANLTLKSFYETFMFGERRENDCSVRLITHADAVPTDMGCETSAAIRTVLQAACLGLTRTLCIDVALTVAAIERCHQCIPFARASVRDAKRDVSIHHKIAFILGSRAAAGQK
jgi:hypothetical protein